MAEFIIMALQLHLLPTQLSNLLLVESRMTSSPAGMSVSDSTGRTQGRTPLPRSGQPREPQFVGPTRSAFSFNIAQAAMDQLTNGQAVALGRIDAQYAQVDASACGL